jgi:hypothetical protein
LDGKRLDQKRSLILIGIGQQSRKILAYRAYSRVCALCSLYGTTVPAHKCSKMHKGSARSMEPRVILSCVVELHDSAGITVVKLCVDVDATTASNLKHKTTNLKSDKGKLRQDIPEQKIHIDWNHRTCAFGGSVFTLARGPKKQSKLDIFNAHRLQK